MRKHLLFVCSCYLALSFSSNAQAPDDYYKSAIGKKKESLKTALASILNNAKDAGYDGLYSIYATSDIREDGKVWDMYSEITNYSFSDKCGNYKNEGDCFNREHTIPQSWFSSRSPMKADAWHVVPTDGKINGMRSNYPLGEVGSVKSSSANGFSKLGSSKTPGYSDIVFEPNDLYKGDFARMYFYMATRYESQVGSWSGGIFSSSYPHLVKWTLDLMLKWHRQDPVSQKEIDRNNAIYKSTQGNRNPYIDYPELVELVFGEKQNEIFDPENTSPEGPVDPEIPEEPETPTFAILEPSNITGESFTINWNAHKDADDYELKVYTLEESTTPIETIHDINITSATLPSGWNQSGYTGYESGKGLRLASSSNNGIVTTSPLNGPAEYQMIITWSSYNNDKSPLYIYQGETLLHTLDFINAETRTDTIYFELSKSEDIQILAKKSNRVYLKRIILNTGAPAKEILVKGYPLLTGNVTSFIVTGLKELTDYYYQLTPVINNVKQTPSAIYKVTTDISNSIGATYEEDQVITYVNDGKINVLNAPFHAMIRVYDLTGKTILSDRIIQNEESFNLPTKGIYFIEITHPSTHITRKIYFQ